MGNKQLDISQDNTLNTTMKPLRKFDNKKPAKLSQVNIKSEVEGTNKNATKVKRGSNFSKAVVEDKKIDIDNVKIGSPKKDDIKSEEEEVNQVNQEIVEIPKVDNTENIKNMVNEKWNNRVVYSSNKMEALISVVKKG